MIKFYTLKGPFAPFCNFDRKAIVVDDEVYDTREHYYQSRKFLDPNFQREIRNLPTPRKAKDVASGLEPLIREGREVKFPPLREDWEQVKYDIMKDAIRYTVEQYPKVAELLLSTGTEEIVEDSPVDSIWGRGPDWKGQNLLGKAWMDIREELRSK